MNRIRLFIFCSSIILTVWLAASYTTQLDGARGTAALHHQTEETLASPRTTASHELTTDSDTPPIAHIK